MSRAQLERRLSEVGTRLRLLRQELAEVDHQYLQLHEEAEDARLRSLVSETPLAAHEHREAARHAEAMARHRSAVSEEILRLESTQDDLLDRMLAGG